MSVPALQPAKLGARSVYRILLCRNFKNVTGRVRCPNIHDLADDKVDRLGDNLTWRVFTGTCGWLPGLYERRHKTWDQGLSTHLGLDFV